MDDQTVEEIDSHGEERWLDELREDLKSQKHRLLLRLVYIPKPGRQQRPLGAPDIGDRVVVWMHSKLVALDTTNRIGSKNARPWLCLVTKSDSAARR